jgi:hypothetical protein
VGVCEWAAAGGGAAGGEWGTGTRWVSEGGREWMCECVSEWGSELGSLSVSLCVWVSKYCSVN